MIHKKQSAVNQYHLKMWAQKAHNYRTRQRTEIQSNGPDNLISRCLRYWLPLRFVLSMKTHRQNNKLTSRIHQVIWDLINEIRQHGSTSYILRGYEGQLACQVFGTCNLGIICRGLLAGYYQDTKPCRTYGCDPL